MRKLIALLTNRLMFIGLFFLLQIGLIIYFVNVLSTDFYDLHFGAMIIGFLITLHLIADDDNPMYKLLWIIVLLTLPVFGVLFYLYSRTERLSISSSSRMKRAQTTREEELKKQPSAFGSEYLKHQKYLDNLNFPVYVNTKSKFLGSGEEKLTELLKALKTAKHFIFMEYFIITKSKMWDQILAVLIEKQKEGVDIKIIYDDFGSATKLPFNYHKYLERLGIEVVRFNPMKLHINYAMNYRDNRKIDFRSEDRRVGNKSKMY